jgi:hypothetical protein
MTNNDLQNIRALHVNLPLIYNGSQVLRIFHSDARFYSEQQNRICYVLQDMKLKLGRIK